MGISRRSFMKAIGATGAGLASASKTVRGSVSSVVSRESNYEKVRRKHPPNESEVYFAPYRKPYESPGGSWPEKVGHVWDAANFDELIYPGDNVAIKLHFGERNRGMYVRPAIVKAAVELVKDAGGYPFVIDTLTAPYYGKTGTRNDVRNHDATAALNGFTKENLGCPVITDADGMGNDHVEIEIDGNQIETAQIGRLMAEADALINLAHGKGHSSGMFGGAIKNLGIGGTSKHGKCVTHRDVFGHWDEPLETEVVGECPGKDDCDAYGEPPLGVCEDWCPYGAFEVDEDGITLDSSVCAEMCKAGLARQCNARLGYGCEVEIQDVSDRETQTGAEAPANCQIRYADQAVGMEAGCYDEGKVGHIVVVKDVTPMCDCLNMDCQPLVPNIGVFASTDMAAVDTAAIDKIKEAPVVPGSAADAFGLEAGDEKFEPVNGQSPYFQAQAVENLGYGTMDYDLIEVDQDWRFPWFLAPLYDWSIQRKMSDIEWPEDKPVDVPGEWYYEE